MKRALILTLLTLGILTMTNQTAEAASKPCTGPEFRWDGTRAPMVRLIRCVFRFGGVGAQADTAVAIADRESHLNPRAHNTATDCRGLFQHLGRYWPGRARALPARFFTTWPNSWAFAARPNAWAAMMIVRDHGWSAWSTA